MEIHGKSGLSNINRGPHLQMSPTESSVHPHHFYLIESLTKTEVSEMSKNRSIFLMEPGSPYPQRYTHTQACAAVSIPLVWTFDEELGRGLGQAITASLTLFRSRSVEGYSTVYERRLWYSPKLCPLPSPPQLCVNALDTVTGHIGHRYSSLDCRSNHLTPHEATTNEIGKTRCEASSSSHLSSAFNRFAGKLKPHARQWKSPAQPTHTHTRTHTRTHTHTHRPLVLSSGANVWPSPTEGAFYNFSPRCFFCWFHPLCCCRSLGLCCCSPPLDCFFP